MMNKNILILDKNQSDISIFSYILNQAGFTVFSVLSRTDFIKFTKEEFRYRIKLVFFNIDMEDIDYQELEVFKKWKIIVMTTYTDKSKLLDVMSLGAYAVLFKPFDVEEVLGIVNTTSLKFGLNR